MKLLRKSIALSLVIALVLSCVCIVQADTVNSKKLAYLREDVTVEYDREILTFKDEQNATVYPLTFNGSTYLPVRAISGLMGEPIEWVSSAHTVFIGKTLSRPMKYLISPEESPYIHTADSKASGKMSTITVIEQKNVLIMYDFEQLTFKDEKGNTVYPINYNGSNYLPLRAIADLMGEDIVWDSVTKTVYIGAMEPEEEEEETPAVREETMALLTLCDKEAEIYNRATSKIATIATWTPEDALLMAAEISSDLTEAEACTLEAKELMKTETFTPEEFNACEKLYEFIEITEHYILVMENIAYMAANGEDYSMFAETFLTFALESERTMNAALEAISCL